MGEIKPDAPIQILALEAQSADTYSWNCAIEGSKWDSTTGVHSRADKQSNGKQREQADDAALAAFRELKARVELNDNGEAISLRLLEIAARQSSGRDRESARSTSGERECPQRRSLHDHSLRGGTNRWNAGPACSKT